MNHELSQPPQRETPFAFISDCVRATFMTIRQSRSLTGTSWRYATAFISIYIVAKLLAVGIHGAVGDRFPERAQGYFVIGMVALYLGYRGFVAMQIGSETALTLWRGDEVVPKQIRKSSEHRWYTCLRSGETVLIAMLLINVILTLISHAVNQENSVNSTRILLHFINVFPCSLFGVFTGLMIAFIVSRKESFPESIKSVIRLLQEVPQYIVPLFLAYFSISCLIIALLLIPAMLVPNNPTQDVRLWILPIPFIVLAIFAKYVVFFGQILCSRVVFRLDPEVCQP